jgi:hypothetical protein
VGVMFPTGAIGTVPNLGDRTMADYVGTGAAIGVEGGIRFARHLFAGLGFEHGAYGKGDKANEHLIGDITTTVSSNLLDARFAYISNADGVGLYAEVGIGYRWLLVSNEVAGPVLNRNSTSSTFRGGELELGAGAYIKAGNYVRFIPKVSFGIGTFGKQDYSCSGTGTQCGTLGDTTNDVTTATHTFIFLGLGGYYNYELGKH